MFVDVENDRVRRPEVWGGDGRAKVWEGQGVLSANGVQARSWAPGPGSCGEGGCEVPPKSGGVPRLLTPPCQSDGDASFTPLTICVDPTHPQEVRAAARVTATGRRMRSPWTAEETGKSTVV